MIPFLLLSSAALAADVPRERDANTLQLGAGALPACNAEPGFEACKAQTQVLLHGDHRLPGEFLMAWDITGTRRSWYGDDGVGEVHAAWRSAVTIGLGWHREWSWGDMRLYAGPSVEYAFMERTIQGDRRVAGLDWLDPGPWEDGRVPGWADVGGFLGNDLDFPVGPVRLGGRWRFRVGAEILVVEPEGDTGRQAGVDIWELHAVTIAAPLEGPVAFYGEVGWINQFTIPVRDPQFRVEPWLVLGLEIRTGRTSPDDRPRRRR